jgi:hypothetical protein
LAGHDRYGAAGYPEVAHLEAVFLLRRGMINIGLVAAELDLLSEFVPQKILRLRVNGNFHPILQHAFLVLGKEKPANPHLLSIKPLTLDRGKDRTILRYKIPLQTRFSMVIPSFSMSDHFIDLPDEHRGLGHLHESVWVDYCLAGGCLA